MVSEREGESCYLSTRSGNGRCGTRDRWMEKREYKYPFRSQWLDKCGTATQRHYRTCQDSKGQDLNSRLSWVWLEDILVSI
jgi:hypothetical protein